MWPEGRAGREWWAMTPNPGTDKVPDALLVSVSSSVKCLITTWFPVVGNRREVRLGVNRSHTEAFSNCKILS
jgi:hypothetical protein